MSEIAIRVEGLRKRYQIGERERYTALRDVLGNAIKAPWRALKAAAGTGRSKDTPLQKHGDHIWAVDSVSLEIHHGEAVGLIGRNGAGKTTLLKILSRITKPTEGRAEIHGRVGSLLEVGTGFHQELTGRENIYLNGAILGMKKTEIDRKFDEIVAFAEVETFLDTPVKHYSSGMYVRLAFAVAAHLEPEILLVDEVLAVGDAAFQKKCLGKMNEVTRAGRTVVFVSHNMSAILNLCSRGLLIERGRITKDGTAAETARAYLESLQVGRSENLLEIRERWGRGRVKFSRVSIEDAQGRRLEHAMSAETVAIVLHYESQQTQTLQNCRVSVAVEDLYGQIFFVCSTEMVSNETRNLPPHGAVRCIIPRLPLSQGRYNLTLFIEVNREIEDWLPAATPLQVVDGDFFGSGRQYPDGWEGKGVLVPHKWEIEKGPGS
ncbi:MAG: ABC transporter ATP-binding protein [Acidobacteria bacterium]|nr:ABC transporter ATP-binding protein [Acidobacteriota bacterium]